ncbi:MAG: hypothetical protein A3F89_03260 [Deltaproteobacteria bacterium RIFCSPLOWO2_12_FULL_50_11]|nr:MAG: hypothetical protein A3F89_03260 [Deltaproteobacteria bacterium RIFCSPLOWO2_12_FULL_50_11]
MMDKTQKYIGWACTYTPLPLIEASGFTPYRLLPTTQAPDRSGHKLHDNLCPHIKKILDRALDNDLPPLAGIVFVNSCDAMHRLADAWNQVRPHDNTILIDLPIASPMLQGPGALSTGPIANDEKSVDFLSQEFSKLSQTLAEWSGETPTKAATQEGLSHYHEIYNLLDEIKNHHIKGTLNKGGAFMQDLYNQAATQSSTQTLESLKKCLASFQETPSLHKGIPLFLFGNVLPDPEAFSLFESCGAYIVADNLCTGFRQFAAYDKIPPGLNNDQDVFAFLARSLLMRTPCARTFDPQKPLYIADQLLAEARSYGVRGAIGHTVKFCDPYLARLPIIREVFKKAKMPLLLLEGDCTLRSMGQHRTRIEAFVEMLG